MKLARQQLKQIIKEEISKVLSENSTDAMKKFLLGISADFSPETTKSDIEQYALDLVDNEVEPQDFASGKLEWGDLVDELSIPIQNAKLIALSMKELGAPETGEWDKRDILQKFFDQLKNAVYMSKQWRTVKEGREVIEDLGRQAVDVRKAGKWTLTRGDDDIL